MTPPATVATAIAPRISSWLRDTRPKAIARRCCSGGAGPGSGALQGPGLDPVDQLGGLLADHGAVLELDRRQDVLPGQLDVLGPLATAVGMLDELVVDARLIERLLDLPARMDADLDPHVAAAMELDGHLVSGRVGLQLPGDAQLLDDLGDGAVGDPDVGGYPVRGLTPAQALEHVLAPLRAVRSPVDPLKATRAGHDPRIIAASRPCQARTRSRAPQPAGCARHVDSVLF